MSIRDTASSEIDKIRIGRPNALIDNRLERERGNPSFLREQQNTYNTSNCYNVDSKTPSEAELGRMPTHMLFSSLWPVEVRTKIGLYRTTRTAVRLFFALPTKRVVLASRIVTLDATAFVYIYI